MLDYFPKSNRNLTLLIAGLACALAIFEFLDTQSGFLFSGNTLVVVLTNLVLTIVTSASLVVLARRLYDRTARTAAYVAAVVRLVTFFFQIVILHGKYAIPFSALANTTTFFSLALALGRPWLAYAFAVPALGFTAAHIAYSIRQIVFELHTVGHLTAVFDPCAAQVGLIHPAYEAGVSGLFALGVASIAAFIGLSTEPFALWLAIIGLPGIVVTFPWGLSTTYLRSHVGALLLVGAPVAFFAYNFTRLRTQGVGGSAAALPPLLWIVTTLLAVALGAHAGWAGWIDQQISQPCM
uniref:Putative NosY n=1 Tax=mine drainage metagenome TaxID=410659 RepID=E6PE34_9ZZZZ